jgi:predicted HicB family RNase H-like nuclease
VECSDEDKRFIGRCPGLFAGAVHGDDEAAKVYKDLCQTVEEWIEMLHKDRAPLPEPLAGKKFSGRFVLRVEPALDRRLAAKALSAGESLNSYCGRTPCKA